MRVFDITVWTDTVCPWCYIGHKSLEKAISLYQRTYPGGSKDEFNFVYLPFYLDLNAPSVGIPWEERVAAKNGADRVDAIRTRLQRVGREHGIEFSFNSKIGSTRDSHRLLQYTRKHNGLILQKLLLEEIYRDHFERDADITSRKALIEAAVAVGLKTEAVREYLESDEGANDVDEAAARSRDKDGISSVPTIAINGKRVEVDGAADVSDFFEAIVDAASA